ncbi:MAG: potassium transporter TrkH [Micavibrio sp.]|nr:potassium transporter TrkH [Micavibrio sp.]
MISFRPIFFIVGVLMCILSIAMLIPMTIDVLYGNDDWSVFLISAIFLGFPSLLTVIVTHRERIYTKLTQQQAFLMTVLCWVIIPIAAAVPFYFSGLNISLIDSVFESVSGISTTGATIITGLDFTAPGILIWRSILQWLGGVGVLIMALTILPFLKIGGMELFKMEALENEKAIPQATQLAVNIVYIYIALTFICYQSYVYVGLEPFDAINHAMTTIATGGYSTKDASIGHFAGYGPSFVAVIFMIMGGLPFIYYLKIVRGNLSIIFKDSQVKWFLAIIGICIGLSFLHAWLNVGYHALDALKYSSLSVVSLITGTGYANVNYMTWGPFFAVFSFFFMMIGGCAGSTTCGIKVFRFQILTSITLSQLRSALIPHGVFTPRYLGKKISHPVAVSVMSFFFLYASSFLVLAVLLSWTGLDFITSMSGAATAISNVGPGLGPIIGPAGNFAPLPDLSKVIMCVGMILGRLELFTVLVLLSPTFWKK